VIVRFIVWRLAGLLASVLPAWGWRLVTVGLILLGAALTLRLLQWLVRRWVAESPAEASDLQRLRRRETAVGVLSSAVLYLVSAVTAFVLLSFFLRSLVTAAAGATLLAAILAFGAQRFLQDVIAGVFILIENQYGVGDFVRLEPTGLSGVVDQLGLRTTVLKNLNGDTYVVPNGQITGVRRTAHRYRAYTIDLVTRRGAAVADALSELVSLAPAGAARFLRAPAIVERRELRDGQTLVRLRADVPPTMEWLVEDLFVKLIAVRLGDALAVEPVVYTLDEDALRRYERTILLD
jgi:moderate conductance mechanosensitive channel